jgi:hypothetical protein
VSDELERREVTCPTCGGSGNFSDNPRIQAEFGDLVCLRCNGAKVIPEPAKAWAERCAAIARELARKLVCKGCIRLEFEDECVWCSYGPGYREVRIAEEIRDAARAVDEKG